MGRLLLGVVSTQWWWRWIVGGISALVLCWIVSNSASFQNCMRQQDDGSAQRALEQSGGVAGGSIVALPSRVVCAGNFADTNQGAITALATLLIAIFTYTLRNATIRLYESAERQLAEFRRSLDIASQHASHMENSVAQSARAADAMEGVATAMATNVETVKGVALTNQGIAERQKLVTEMQSRAYLSVGLQDMISQNLTTPVKVRFEPRMRLVNDGVMTPAYKVTYRVAADVLPHPLRSDFEFPLPDALPTRSVSTIGPRQQKILSAVVPKLYSDEEAEQIKIGNGQRLHIWGRVDYGDAFKIRRYVKFCMTFGWVGKFADGNDIIMGYDTAHHNDSD